MATSEDELSRLRARYEDAPCGLATIGANGMLIRVNQTLCRWLGYGAEELVEKKRFADLLTVGCRIFHQTHWSPLLQMQGSVAEVQLELLGRDGQSIPVLVNALRKRSGQQSEDELAIFAATDRRKYERELLLARKRADALLLSERAAQEELNAALRDLERDASQRAVLAEQLIGIVSHDLRTPLNAVLLGASMLASTATPAQSRTVDRILSSTRRANRLIADLLDFTQARLGGGLRVSPRPLDLHALIEEGLEELRLASPGRAIEHRKTGDGACTADGDRLVQIVNNLVNNALAYGAPDQPITVCTSTAPEGFTLAVHNLGPAIPPDLLPHLFEPLRRGEQELKRGSRSVGLGLYIVQQLARAHGGDIHVTSTQAEGTRFTIAVQQSAASDG